MNIVRLSEIKKKYRNYFIYHNSGYKCWSYKVYKECIIINDMNALLVGIDKNLSVVDAIITSTSSHSWIVSVNATNKRMYYVGKSGDKRLKSYIHFAIPKNRI